MVVSRAASSVIDRRRRERLANSNQPMACVLGGMDIVSPLGRAGIRCAVATPKNGVARYSRHVDAVLDGLDARAEPAAYVARLVDWARRQPVRPVLFYPTDADLVMVSRHREQLREGFTFVIPDARLVEDLADKQQFRALAERLRLPTPPSRCVPAGADTVGDTVRTTFPVIVKPVVHRTTGLFAEGLAKAARAESAADLEYLLGKAGAEGTDCIVQTLIPGPESCIESYHAFVDQAGTTIGEFTGEKLRTFPLEYGESTAVSVGRRADVLEAGRRVLSTVGLRSGVAKVDFKRGPDGRLWLLEVNPRFNLWHNPGSVAGVNLPAMVYGHLTGRQVPARPFRSGVTWCNFRTDRCAAVAVDIPLISWLRFAAGADTRHLGDWDDPMPLLRGRVLPALLGREPRRPRGSATS